jgi:hypothetical protein
MTSEHYLREIAELLKEMNQRLGRIEQRMASPVEEGLDMLEKMRLDYNAKSR